MGIGTAVLLAQGSSPRVRGSLSIATRLNPRDGIIPAGAGLTAPTADKEPVCWDLDALGIIPAGAGLTSLDK